MGRLYYDIVLEEKFEGSETERGRLVRRNIPHYEQIKKWLPKEWNSCEIHKTFDGILKDKVLSCRMKCFQNHYLEGYVSFARITVEFLPSFRLSKKRKEECISQLDAQMADGFGESYDGCEIPGADGWKLSL